MTEDADIVINDYSYRILKWLSDKAVSVRHLPKTIYYVCKIIRGENVESKYPSVKAKMESLCVPEEYREAVLEKIIRSMLILSGWSDNDPQLDEKVNEVVDHAKRADKNWGV